MTHMRIQPLFAGSALVAMAAFCGAARSADDLPTCRLKKIPAILCMHPKAAAEMWNQVGFNKRIAFDPNNKQLIAESQCTLVSGEDFVTLRVNHNMGPGKVATSQGWVLVALVTVPEYTGAMWIATNYLHDGCKTQWPKMPENGWPTVRLRP